LESCSNIHVLIFKCIEADTCIQHLHGSKKLGFYTFVCGEKSNPKNTSQFKTTSFKYWKASITLKRHNMKSQIP
jgi:hypothetical protein